MNNRGSIGVICILIMSLLLILVQSTYSMIASDYQYNKAYVSQRQVIQAVSSAMQALERVAGAATADINLHTVESLPPDDTLNIYLNTYSYNGVRWLVSKAVNSDMEITMVKGLIGLPDSGSILYNHCIVGTVFNIAPTANIAPELIFNYQTQGINFVEVTPLNYSKYAFLLPDSGNWSQGIGKNVYADTLGDGLHLPGNKTIRGNGVFVSSGDITISAGSNYPDATQFIATGNIIVESNVRLNNTFLLSGTSIKLSQGSRVTGKIFAKRGVVIEKNVTVQDLPIEKLLITTDKYIW